MATHTVTPTSRVLILEHSFIRRLQKFMEHHIGCLDLSLQIDLVTVFDAILTSRQTRAKLQCLYENLISNNFRKMAVLKKI